MRAAALLAQGKPSAERERIIRNAEQYIQGGSWIPAITADQFPLLFYPSNADLQVALGAAIHAAQEAGDLKKPSASEPQGLLPLQWATWPGLPPIPPDSPLRYWLPGYLARGTRDANAENSGQSEEIQDAQTGQSTPDYSMLAHPVHLIEAFGSFTGMSENWFKNLKDIPGLKAARKFVGSGGRNYQSPLFCPYEVLKWLLNPKRKKGRPISAEAGWRRLGLHFPKVYTAHEWDAPDGVSPG